MDLDNLHARESVDIAAPATEVFSLITTIERTGEWSPVCQRCSWENPQEAHKPGAWFRGFNKTPRREWETRSCVTAYNPEKKFAWVVGENVVEWGFEVDPINNGTRLTEVWKVTEDGIAFFRKRYGDKWEEELGERRDAALDGIPHTLKAIKRIAESEHKVQ